MRMQASHKKRVPPMDFAGCRNYLLKKDGEFHKSLIYTQLQGHDAFAAFAVIKSAHSKLFILCSYEGPRVRG